MNIMDRNELALALLDQLQALEANKEELQIQLKAITEAIAETKTDIMEQMELGNIPSCDVGGRRYYCKQSFKATPTITKEELVQAFLENGRNDKVTSYVHPQTLNSYIDAELRENHSLPLWLKDKIDVSLVKKLQSKKI